MPSETVTSPDYQGAQRYALERLERELTPSLCYHSLWHTRDEVALRARWLAQAENLSPEIQDLICSAACFHDIGFVHRPNDHEILSARIAAEILPHFRFTSTQITWVQGMILATRVPQRPKNRLEEILADADLDVLGRDDYFSRNLALRAELARSGVTMSDEAWYSQQLRFMRFHRYFTKTAYRQRFETKQHNTDQLRIVLADCCPEVEENVVATLSPSFATP
jgi:uncharacterized protein